MKEKATKLLRAALNDPKADFRDGQWECIKALLSQERMLVVQRTGWGKSMVYFLATRILRDQGAGVTLLISPLLALMRNQIQAAQGLNIRADTINSSNRDDWEEVQEKVLENTVDILLISPERLANDDFRENILIPIANRVGLFVVDEAHCISDWGHDFRPDYKRIVRVLQALPPNIPVLATTATANNRVVADVAGQLGQNLHIERGPLVRESLRLQNIMLPSPAARMAWLAENMPRMPGSGVVYTLTIRDAERVADWLQHNNIDARAYHSKVTNREELEAMLLGNRIKALVATVALGMGFDKPDLGFVIHFQRPGSVVHYYQQVGRAGRAINAAYGILFSGHEDDDIIDFFIRNAFPPQFHVDLVIGALNQAESGLSVPMLQREINLGQGEIEKTMKFLSVETPSPVTKQDSRWFAVPIEYQLDQQVIEQLYSLRRDEQSQMQAYMQTSECLMQFLSQALDDPHAAPCGRCAQCMGEPLLPETINPDLANKAAVYLKRSFRRIYPRKRWPERTALSAYGFKGSIPLDLQMEEGRALSEWGDAGWGEMVSNGKYRDHRFSDDLIGGCIQMIQAWMPQPEPTWLTCVPSMAHPQLVPEFAARLAGKLGIPFASCVKKVKINRPQKEMENSFQQAKNLNGVFAVEDHDMINKPVFLVDDLVDSGWTMTVVAALLRQAGCPAVFPLALALATHSSMDRR